MACIKFDDDTEVKLSAETTERLRKELVKEETYHVGQVFQDEETKDLFMIVSHYLGNKSYEAALVAFSSTHSLLGTDVNGWRKIESIKAITLKEFKRLTYYWKRRKPVNKPLILGE